MPASQKAMKMKETGKLGWPSQSTARSTQGTEGMDWTFFWHQEGYHTRDNYTIKRARASKGGGEIALRLHHGWLDGFAFTADHAFSTLGFPMRSTDPARLWRSVTALSLTSLTSSHSGLQTVRTVGICCLHWVLFGMKARAFWQSFFLFLFFSTFFYRRLSFRSTAGIHSGGVYKSHSALVTVVLIGSLFVSLAWVGPRFLPLSFYRPGDQLKLGQLAGLRGTSSNRDDLCNEFEHGQANESWAYYLPRRGASRALHYMIRNDDKEMEETSGKPCKANGCCFFSRTRLSS